MNDEPLDGNVTAGSLAELFAFDVTIAVTTCAACGDSRPVAELHAYVHAPGIVLRCTSCGGVQLRFVRAPDRAWLDVRGVQILEIRLPAEREAGAPQTARRDAPGALRHRGQPRATR